MEASPLRAALDLLETQVDAAQQDLGLPGCSAVVVLDQQVLWSKGYGCANIEEQIPATADTIYRVGSITKLFAATMLMQLRDAGRLHLDDSLSKYCPEIAIRSRFPDAQPPTFRQIVTHLSGLPRDAPLEYTYHFTADFPAPALLLESLRHTEMTAPAWTGFRYSNLGFNLLGYTLAHIAQQPYEQYVAEHILQPLHMQHSGFAIPPTLQGLMATGYGLSEDTQTLERAPYQQYGAPAGMLYSSVADMASFLRLQYRDGAQGGEQIVGGNTLREMLTPLGLDPHRHYDAYMGIGWAINDFHEYLKPNFTGGTSGYETHVAMIPALKLGVAVFANLYAERMDTIKIGTLMLETLVPAVQYLQTLQEREAMRQLVATLQQYTGRYCLTHSTLIQVDASGGQQGMVEVTTNEDGLDVTCVLPGLTEFAFRLLPYEPHVFHMEGLGRSMPEYVSGGECVTFDADGQEGRARMRWRDLVFERASATAPPREG